MSPQPFTRRRFLLSSAAGISSTALLAACGGGGGGTPGGGASSAAAAKVSQADIDAAMAKPTELTFWSWVPDLQNEVDLFEKKYPAVKVKLVNVGQGTPHYQKMRAAIKSGQGAPDVTQVEFQYIPSFTLGGDLLDISPYGAADIKSQYPDWVWSQVVNGDAVYGVPQDVGPMGLLYREDLLQAAGVEVPKTWDEFATAADKYHSANPKSYLSNLAPNQAGQFIAYMWQLGARPFSFDGTKTVKVDLASEQGKKVAQFWGDLSSKDLVSVDTDFVDSWYQGLSNGKYATWPTAAWGPIFLQGTAKKTSGKWRAAELPQWDASTKASGNWGGSTDAVLKSTKNPIQAATLALWINTDPESALDLATKQFLFPPSTTILKEPEFAEQKPEFFGGQKVNELFTTISDTVGKDFGWVPFMDFVYTNFTDTFGKAMADKTDLVAGLQKWQDAVAGYAKAQGFTVSESLSPSSLPLKGASHGYCDEHSQDQERDHHTAVRKPLSVAKKAQYRAAYIFVLPFFIIFLAMIIVPLGYAGYLSFFKQQLIGGSSFAGFANYTRALTDPEFLSGVARMGLILLIQVPVMLAFSLFFALALDSGMVRLQKFMRLGIYVPYAVPAVVATLMWGYLYGPDFGPFAQLADLLGVSKPQFFSKNVILFSIINVVNLEFIGYNMIIIYAALRSIPTDLYEAARVDGASEIRIAWSIKIPAVRPALILTVIFSVIGTFQLFNEPNLLKILAPNAISSSYTPNLYAYTLAFVNQDANYAAAIAFLLGILIMILSYAVQLWNQRKENAR